MVDIVVTVVEGERVDYVGLSAADFEYLLASGEVRNGQPVVFAE